MWVSVRYALFLSYCINMDFESVNEDVLLSIKI